MSKWLGWRVETWWQLEKLSGRLWDRACTDGVSCWLDWLPAFTYRHRKNAERAWYLRARRRDLRKYGGPRVL